MRAQAPGSGTASNALLRRAYSATCRPIAEPASLSKLQWMPPQSRLFAASSAALLKLSQQRESPEASRQKLWASPK
jgi:hypothetical protein